MRVGLVVKGRSAFCVRTQSGSCVIPAHSRPPDAVRSGASSTLSSPAHGSYGICKGARDRGDEDGHVSHVWVARWIGRSCDTMQGADTPLPC